MTTRLRLAFVCAGVSLLGAEVAGWRQVPVTLTIAVAALSCVLWRSLSMERARSALPMEHRDVVALAAEVRSAVAFEGSAASGEDQRDPIPASLAEQVAAVDGVATVEPSLFRYAQLVDQDGEAVTPQAAPTIR